MSNTNINTMTIDNRNIPQLICPPSPTLSSSSSDETSSSSTLEIHHNNTLTSIEKKECSRSISDPGYTNEISKRKDNKIKHLSPIYIPPVSLQHKQLVKSADVLNAKDASTLFPFLTNDDNKRWMKSNTKFASSTGCINKLGLDEAPIMHPAISSTSLTSATRLKHRPIVGKSGELFNHPAIVLPFGIKLKKEFSKDATKTFQKSKPKLERQFSLRESLDKKPKELKSPSLFKCHSFGNPFQ